MKVMWLSVAPWVPTGYGNQTALTVPRIKQAGHEIAISSTHGSVQIVLNYDGITVYPADHTTLNKRMLKHHIKREYGSLDGVQVISLWDIWPWVDPQYGGMVADFDGLNMAAWVPIDSTPVPPKTRMALDKWNVRPIAMSKHGLEQLTDAGYDALYAPHAVDTKVLKPAEDRAEARKRVGLPADKFVVGMVAFNQGVNPPRKAFPQVLQAFAEFQRRHDDAFLYLHTEVLGVHDGLNLLAMAEVMGIPPDALGMVPQMNYLAGEITPERMADIYSGMDVLVNTSYGEGFGIPIVEAQACGTPVIVSHWTSMPELCGAGWSVGGQPWYNPANGAYWLDPSTDEILEALETAYRERDNLELRGQARAFAETYDVDRVFAEYWVPVLEALDRPREVAPLPNRQMRRAARKAGVA